MRCIIKENMDTAKLVGLAFLGGGIFLLIAYGIYKALENVTSIDPVILISSLAILFGIVVLLIATAMDKKSGEEKKIKKEDLEP